MSVTSPLREGQFQIGNIRFGVGTPFNVSSWDTSGYDVAPGDYQPSRSDNLRFGHDFLTPTSVTWEMSAMQNKYLDSMGFVSGNRPALPGGIDAVDALHQEWKADDIRQIYGAVKWVTYRRDGKERRFYGRPRQFASGARTMKSEWIPIVCNFQRADTISYAEEESFAGAKVGSNGRVKRLDGKAPSWINMFLIGPITNPIITIGSTQVSLPGVVLAAGQVLNISSYPWERRVVRSDGINLRPKLVTPYLDQLYLNPGADLPLSLAGSGSTADTFLSLGWREAYNTL